LAGSVPHQPPEPRPHGLQPLAEQTPEAHGGGGIPGLKEVVLEERLLPALFVDALQEQIGDDPALVDFEGARGDVGSVSHGRGPVAPSGSRVKVLE